MEKYAEGANVLESLPDGTLFRIKLPDGTEIGTGIETKDLVTEDWFAPQATGDYNGKYIETKKDVGPTGTPDPVFAYDLTLNPGQSGAGSFAAQRERLLRYINLGGWFSVSVNEGLCSPQAKRPPGGQGLQLCRRQCGPVPLYQRGPDSG